MSEKYKPKQGDRVRVVLEGEVGRAYQDGKFWVDTNYIHPDAEHVVSIEKLAPSEPKWVYGAVVKVGQYVPAVYAGETWRTPMGTEHTADIPSAWRAGTLKVLWNGNTEDE